MSIYESISRASLKTKRTLFDYNISLLGHKVRAIRISVIQDRFHDAKIDKIVSQGDITAVIRFPTEMPLERYRLGAKADTDETRTYFFELLPIESYTKLSDKIEKNDFLFFFLEDEQNNKIPYLFQVTDNFGKFEIGMVWKKQYLAPYYGYLTDEIIRYLEEFVISDEFDKLDSPYISSQEDLNSYLSDDFKNLFPVPLNPKSRPLYLEPGDYTAQCAEGSFEIMGFIVTPDNPYKFELFEAINVFITVKEGCKFPSIYQSKFFHPFVLSERKGNFISFVAEEQLYSFNLRTVFMDTYQYYICTPYSDETHEFIEDNFHIIGMDEFDGHRPVLFVEDFSGNFIELYIENLKNLAVTYKINEDIVTKSLGMVTEQNMKLDFDIKNENITISYLNSEVVVENKFMGSTILIGYKPNSYLNDFISQVYF